MPTYHGICQCGQTEWEVTLDKAEHIICHCNTCKTLSGGAYTLNMIIPKPALAFTKGGDALKNFSYVGASGKPVYCYYCPNCTAHPYHHQTVLGDDTIILRTALLKERKELGVAAEIWGKAKYGWHTEVATTFELLPPELS